LLDRREFVRGLDNFLHVAFVFLDNGPLLVLQFVIEHFQQSPGSLFAA
jgi:hypothetical protein